MIDHHQLEILDRLYKCILNPTDWGDLIERINADIGSFGINRGFNYEVRHSPMQPEGIPETRLQAA